MAKRNKFNASKTEVNGIVFDSKGEAQRYKDLLELEFNKQIKELTLQPVFNLMTVDAEGKVVKLCTYRADYMYLERGNKVVEDYKGSTKTALYRLKSKMFRLQHPDIEFRETTYMRYNKTNGYSDLKLVKYVKGKKIK